MESPARKRTSDSKPERERKTVALDSQARHIKVIWHERDKDDKLISQGSTGLCFRLLPGLNDNVPVDVWTLMQANETWAKWIAEGIVKRVTKSPASMSPADAKALIERSSEVGAMQRWRRKEKRGELRGLLDKKIAAMSQLAVAKQTQADEPDQDFLEVGGGE